MHLTSDRSRRPGLLALSTAAALVVGLPGAAPAQAATGGPPTAAPLAADLTLLTGDRVSVSWSAGRPPRVAVRPGPGRTRVGFRQSWDGSRLSVVPADASALLARGVLDPALFDVVGLARQGFGRRPVSVIVGYEGGAAGRSAHGRAPAGSRTRDLPSLDAGVYRLDPARPAALWSGLTGGAGRRGARSAAPGIRKIWLNGIARPLLDRSAAQVGAPAAWRAGFTGKGVTVAVLDSGVKLDHPDLTGRVAESRDFTNTRPDGGDDVGHGTHVAGTVAGSGKASAGKYRGIAPDAALLNGKVCGLEECPFDAIIAGMEWAASKAKVVNLSLGGEPTDGTDPLSQAVNSLTARTGALFVVAAGNAGRNATVGTPGSADAALTVASVTKSDQLSTFSSRGPRVGDFGMKPDIAAPGDQIVAARAKGTPVGDINLPEHGQKPIDDNYLQISGTSMATPHVAGAAAILAQARPDWKAPQLKAALMASANPLAGISPLAQGAGRLDVARALAQTLTAEPGGVGVFAKWPHREKVTRHITYRNNGTKPLTVRLTLTGLGPDGRPAPTGVFTLSAQELKIPAGSTAKVGLVLDPNVGAFGQYTAQLTAEGGGQRASAPVALLAEDERYELTVTTSDSAGPMPYQMVNVVEDRTGDTYGLLTDEKGIARERLPKGTYRTVAVLDDPRLDSTQFVLVSGAPVHLSVDRATGLSSRGAVKARLSVDRPGAEPHENAHLEYVHSTGHGMGMFAPERIMSVVPRADAGSPYWFSMSGDVTAPAQSGRDIHHLLCRSRGSLPEPVCRPARRDLVPVTVRVRGVGARTSAHVGFTPAPLPTAVTFELMAETFPIAAPGQRVEYFSPGRWVSVSGQGPAGGDLNAGYSLWGDAGEFRAGQPASIDFDRAVFGPTGAAAARAGNLVMVSPSPLADPWPGRDPFGFTERPPGSYTLSRNGKTVLTSDNLGFGMVEVPAEAGDYRLALDSRHGLPWLELSTRVRAEWGFRSAHAPGREATLLPMLAVRFTPALDQRNTAPAGKPFSLPVGVTRLDLPTGAPKVRTLGVEVSYDDGRSWVKAALEPTGPGWTARLNHPTGAAHVSLRATVADTDGNTHRQVVHRAYLLK